MNKFDLTGKTAIVTGGAGLLGRYFCYALADFGANIVVADKNGDGAKKLEKELIKEKGCKAIGVSCDVTSTDSVNGLIDITLAAYGSIDILHNNASITATTSSDPEAFFEQLETYSLDAWREVMSVNIDGMFLVAQAVGKQMVKQGRGGSIIQTASIYGIMGSDQRIYEGSDYLGRPINTPAAYSTSKAAVVGLTKHLATYWADKKIRVNTLSPGGIENGQNDEFKRRYSARIPLGRMAEQDEMAGALIFLASDASSYVTGQNIIVDGGLEAW
jgi:NAD(P)-dependent dehydrogenase (short-subunit alcohol dehydrogenase family)